MHANIKNILIYDMNTVNFSIIGIFSIGLLSGHILYT
jgi:hypothetical protein